MNDLITIVVPVYNVEKISAPYTGEYLWTNLYKSSNFC